MTCNLRERSLCCQWAFHWEWREVWQTKTTKIQKCLHKLFSNHVDVFILRCNWDFDPPYIVERDKSALFSRNHITLSLRIHAGQQDLQRCFLPLAAEERRRLLGRSCHKATIQTDGGPGGYFSHINLAFSLFFSPVTWLYELKCWIFCFYIKCLT